jgi:uncharacterized BrkB/YihY/UPF0761 family membrane protein
VPAATPRRLRARPQRAPHDGRALRLQRGAAMPALNRLPGFQRSPPGREWALFRRLPVILVLGTALPMALALVLWWAAPGQPSAAEERDLLLLTYRLIGLVVLHWTLVLTVAIGCVIVWLMKGPAYVADAYPLPGAEQTVARR